MNHEQYIKALGKDADLAIIPQKIASTLLNVNLDTIRRNIESGKLETITVDGKQYILAKQFHDIISTEQTIKQELRANLEECARNGKTIVYGKLMEAVGMSSTNPRDRKKIGFLLGQLSRDVYEERRALGKGAILLSVLAQLKGKNLPSEGFFELAESLGLFDEHKHSRELFTEKQMEKCFSAYSED